MFGISLAFAQSSPNFQNGPPALSAQELNAAFQNKQDYIFGQGVVVSGPVALGLVPVGTAPNAAAWSNTIPIPFFFTNNVTITSGDFNNALIVQGTTFAVRFFTGQTGLANYFSIDGVTPGAAAYSTLRIGGSVLAFTSFGGVVGSYNDEAPGAWSFDGQMYFQNLATTPGSQQPLCINPGTKQVYIGSGGLC